jgi:hypothetical protein
MMTLKKQQNGLMKTLKALATEDNVVTWFIGQCKIEKKAINFDNVISAQFDE